MEIRSSGIRSSGRAHGNQHVRKPALPESGLLEELMEIRSSGNQVFRKSGLPEIRSSGNQVFRKSGLPEELMEISMSRNQHFQNQVFRKR